MYLKNDLEPRGVIFPKYQPVASHGEPIQAPGHPTFRPQFSVYAQKYKNKTGFLICWRVLRGGKTHIKRTTSNASI